MHLLGYAGEVESRTRRIVELNRIVKALAPKVFFVVFGVLLRLTVGSSFGFGRVRSCRFGVLCRGLNYKNRVLVLRMRNPPKQ